ncbi:MAG: DUF1592 domain-containing protein [Gammaproteobacteria bacterium]|nr:DUF1592 domain-containing protein [Gammaproteobacteria bacterium]
MTTRIRHFLLLFLAGITSSAHAQLDDAEHQQQFIQSYCVECHNFEDWAGSLDLELANIAEPLADAEIWEKVMVKFRGNLMPPVGQPAPDAEERLAFVNYLQAGIDSSTLANPNPGNSSLHRLNRTEYGNVIRDLLGLHVDISEYLPADDEGYGFDNIADVLRTSPSLLEQYLTASRKIAELAVGDLRQDTVSKVYKVPPDAPQSQHLSGLPLGTRGGILIEHNFPLDGEYEFNSYLTRNIVGYMTGLEWANQFEISIDGERVFLEQVGGEADNLMSDTNFADAADTIDQRLKVRVPVEAGLHRVTVTFIQKNSAETHEPLELHTRDLDLQNMTGLPTLDYVDILGPYNVTGSGDTASRQKIFSCYPATAQEEPVCAAAILGRLGKLAYRRLLTDEDMSLLKDFYLGGHAQGGFERGIQVALRFLLTSPEFLFRSEPDPENVAPGEVYALDDLALASRMAFFLWSSMPDEELIDVAAAGQLSDQAVFDAQVERMLQNPKASTLVDNFAAQWLFLRNLQSSYPDTRTFPNFDNKLRNAFRSETEMFVTDIFRNDHSILDLLTADWTYVNDRLAAHYGIPNIYGSHFRKVNQVDDERRGLLGQGSILTVTSYPNRTSPVLRGKWVMENIIGSPAPSPPPNVPDLQENQGSDIMSVRERLELHRQDPVCSSCHSLLDPLGFALERFDAIGRFRTKEEGGMVNSGGQLGDGTQIDGINDLRTALLAKPENFVDNLTEKLLIYALGRGLEPFDMPVVRTIRKQAAQEDYRFSALVKGIISSVPFTMKRAAENPGAQVASSE